MLVVLNNTITILLMHRVDIMLKYALPQNNMIEIYFRVSFPWSYARENDLLLPFTRDTILSLCWCFISLCESRAQKYSFCLHRTYSMISNYIMVMNFMTRDS